MEIEKEVSSVMTREDLSKFLNILAKDFNEDKASWENHDIGSYLEAISAWLIDTKDNPKFPNILTWSEVAGFFAIGKDYE